MISREITTSILKGVPFGALAMWGGSLLLPYYHVVSDDNPKHIRHLYSCRKVDEFNRDLDFLLKHYKPVSLEDLHASLKHGKKLQGKCFHLTFDDGFRECYDIIGPVLKSKGVPATFFVCSDFIDNNRLFYRNKISLLIDEFGKGMESDKSNYLAAMLKQQGVEYHGLNSNLMSLSYDKEIVIDKVAELLGCDFGTYLKKHQPYLSKIQIEKLLEHSFTIGSHSMDHPRYQVLSLQKQVQQTKGSMAEIERLFGAKIRAFAFPHSDDNIPMSFFNETNKDVDIYFGTNRMKNDQVHECLQRFSLEDNRFSCEEIIRRNLLLQAYWKATFRGTIRRGL